MNIIFSIFNYFTGSFPPFEKGLHLTILHTHFLHHLKAPYFSIDSFVYSEQVGEYLQYQPGKCFFNGEWSGLKYF
jgi:hypothetical protein